MPRFRRPISASASVGIALLALAACTRIALASTGTLSCTVASTCTGGVVVFKMFATSDSHAELASQSNYSNLVCCSGVPGLSNSCSGTHAVVLNLNKTTNSHVEEGTLSNYTNQACLSVSGGGAVSIAYQNSNCTGYDTTLASLSATTNAHVGNASAYTLKVCGYALNGTLSTDIVDAGGASVSSPSVAMSTTQVSYACQNSTGTLGITAQKIRVSNITPTPTWTLSLAASSPTAVWTSASSTYDFNDSSSCSDGGDADSVAGQMTVNPAGATVTPQSGCSNTGLSLGSSAAFNEGTTNSITLLSATSGAGTNCYWDMTGIGLTQKVPAEQASGTYTLNMTISIVAS